MKSELSLGIFISKQLKKFITKKLKITYVNEREILPIIYVPKAVWAISNWRQIGKKSAKVKEDALINALINLVVPKVLSKAWIEHCFGSKNRSQR